MAATNSSYLPPEIVEEILALLPIDSIHRFRFLSKSWFSLLAIKFELPKKLLRCRRKGDQFLFDAVVLPEYGGDVKDTVYTGPELPGGIRSYAFVGSCNGLVCLQRKKQFFYAKCTKELEMLVLNPVTGICRKLPERRHYNPYVYGFGYDSASDDYKVFLAGDGANVEIFSLKTGSWKKVKNPDRDYLQDILCLGGTGILLNGALHWGNNTKIIAFDLNKEMFYDVPCTPNQISRRNLYGHYTLGVVGEYLCMCTLDRYISFDTTLDRFVRKATNIVWVMKEYCNGASWVPFISYTIASYGYLEYVSDFIPRSFKDGRYMLLEFAETIHRLKWNNNLEESDEAEKYSKKIKFYIYSRNEDIPYTETLASPYTETLTSPYAS
ncbi:hypothetical protein Tsubulata_029948 [Turnera subulata]|uniref:F-box domain-containing protein n=1 Tax=Turnera subulata TaxID=218843 RepID=A0A9Q0F5B0_9ROSI|nr:hypothetical protein Tsubulata_029948 [Turnera subulata]